MPEAPPYPEPSRPCGGCVEQQIPFRLVTNTTSRSRSGIVGRMAGYGIDVSEPEVFTATLAGAETARAAGFSKVAPFIPEPALEDLKGLDLVGGTSAGAGAPGPQTRYSWATWPNAGPLTFFRRHSSTSCRVLPPIALSRDRYWLKDERLTLDAGPFVAALEFATGQRVHGGREAELGVLCGRARESGSPSLPGHRNGWGRPLVRCGRRPAGRTSGLAGANRQVPGVRASGRAVSSPTASSAA